MIRPPVEEVADEIIASDAARAAESRISKPVPGTTPGPGAGTATGTGPATDTRTERAYWLVRLIVSTIAVTILGGLFGFFFLGGPPGAVSTPTPPAVAVVTAPPATATGLVSTPSPPPVVASTPSPTPLVTPTPAITPTPLATPPRDLPAASIEEALGKLGADQASTDALAGQVVRDEGNDFFTLGGEDVTLQPALTDISRVVLIEARVSEDFAAGVAERCGSEGWVCGGGLEILPGEHLGYAIEVGATIEQLDEAVFEMGLTWLEERPSDGSVPDLWQGGPRDFRYATNTIAATRFPPPGMSVAGPLRFFFTRGSPSFVEQPTGAFSYVSGNTIITFIPATEWERISFYRAFTYYQPQPAGTAILDTWPQISSDPPVLIEPIPAIEFLTPP